MFSLFREAFGERIDPGSIRYDRTKYRFVFKIKSFAGVRVCSLSLNGFVDLYGMIDDENIAEAERAFMRRRKDTLRLVRFAHRRLPGNRGRMHLGRGTVMDFHRALGIRHHLFEDYRHVTPKDEIKPDDEKLLTRRAR